MVVLIIQSYLMCFNVLMISVTGGVALPHSFLTQFYQRVLQTPLQSKASGRVTAAELHKTPLILVLELGRKEQTIMQIDNRECTVMFQHV